MSGLQSKKAIAKPRSRGISSVAGAASPKPEPVQAETTIFRIMVKQASDLGGGYFVVKLVDVPGTTPAQKRNGLGKGIPPITTRKLHSVLEKYRLGEAAEERLSKTEQRPPLSRESMAKITAGAMANRIRQLKSGALLSSVDYCDRRGVSRQAVSKAVKEQRVFYLDGPSGTQLYPAFFASQSANRRDLERVSKELGDLPGDSKWQFFTTPKVSLGGKTPIQVLEKGDLERVLMAAAGFRER